jgi:membrane protein
MGAMQPGGGSGPTRHDGPNWLGSLKSGDEASQCAGRPCLFRKYLAAYTLGTEVALFWYAPLVVASYFSMRSGRKMRNHADMFVRPGEPGQADSNNDRDDIEKNHGQGLVPRFKLLLKLLKDSTLACVNDNTSMFGAALAYYTAFSLAPILVIAIAVAGLLFGPEAASGQIAAEIKSVVGDDGAKAIESMVADANKPTSSAWATVIGFVMLLVGAAGLFGQLQGALNTIWKVKAKPGRGIMGFIRDRFLSFSMVLGTAFLLLISLVVNAILAALGSLFGEWGASIVGQGLNLVTSFAVITLLFAMIFRFLPDAKIAWRDVWLGAVITSLLFSIGKFIIGFYLGQAGTASAYGAAGSLAVLLIWLYYSAQIFLFGAELTKAYADCFGSRIIPKENAMLASGAN